MINAIVVSTVKNFDQWLPVFEGHAEDRKKAGCSGAQVFQGLKNPNEVSILFTWSSAEDLGKFMSDPEVQKMIAAAGTIGAPVATLCTKSASYQS